MKVRLCIAKRPTLGFNIGRTMGQWPVAYHPEIFSLRDCPHTDCRDDATVVSHQREGAVVSVQHRII
jgi:hypothetical protein